MARFTSEVLLLLWRICVVLWMLPALFLLALPLLVIRGESSEWTGALLILSLLPAFVGFGLLIAMVVELVSVGSAEDLGTSEKIVWGMLLCLSIGLMLVSGRYFGLENRLLQVLLFMCLASSVSANLVVWSLAGRAIVESGTSNSCDSD